MKVLILCTGNSCRSQMAHGFLQSLCPSAEVFSAGTQPAGRVHPMAVQVMAESGIDLSGHVPVAVVRYLDEEWDYVVTVCGEANDSCPLFTGEVKHRVHIGFDDPSRSSGSPEFIESEFRGVRDEIGKRFREFANNILKANEK